MECQPAHYEIGPDGRTTVHVGDHRAGQVELTHAPESIGRPTGTGRSGRHHGHVHNARRRRGARVVRSHGFQPVAPRQHVGPGKAVRRRAGGPQKRAALVESHAADRPVAVSGRGQNRDARRRDVRRSVGRTRDRHRGQAVRDPADGNGNRGNVAGRRAVACLKRERVRPLVVVRRRVGDVRRRPAQGPVNGIRHDRIAQTVEISILRNQSHSDRRVPRGPTVAFDATGGWFVSPAGSGRFETPSTRG